MNAVVFALFAAAGNLAGGYAVVRHERRSLAVIDLFLAFGAGFMIAVALLEMAPEAFARRTDAPIYMLGGYLAVHLAQHVLIPHFHFGEETHHLSARQGFTVLAGLMIHTFFDGVGIASGFLVSDQLGLLLFLAVFLHKLPEGVTMSSVMLAGGQGRSRALGAALLIAVDQNRRVHRARGRARNALDPKPRLFEQAIERPPRKRAMRAAALQRNIDQDRLTLERRWGVFHA